MNRDNGAFQEGIFSGDWSKWNSLESERRFVHTGGGGRTPLWLIGLMLGMVVGAFAGANAGGLLGGLASGALGAGIGAFLFFLPVLIFRMLRGLFRLAAKPFQRTGK